MAKLGNPRRRLRVGLLAMAFVLSLFAGRLLQLQGIDAPAYAAQAEEKRLAHKVLFAPRGSITDTHGVPLATNAATVNIKADPRYVTDPARTADILAPILRVDRADLEPKLANRSKTWVYLVKNADPRVWERIRQLKTGRSSDPEAADAAHHLQVITSEPETKRLYPSGELAANVVGFVRNRHGAGGIEYQKDELLSGRDGKLSYERAAGGGAIPSEGNQEQDAVPGRNVQLTLDRDLQWVAQQAITRQVRASRAESGSVVAMDPRTGQVLALATAPTFDPNNYRQAPSTDLGNRPLSEVYEPGSTGKVMTMAAALERGVVKPTTAVTVPPKLRRSGRTINDHQPHPTQRLTVAGVLAKSSNIGTVLTAERLGNDQLYRYLRLFGIAEPTGLGLNGESRGILAEPGDWSAVRAANIAFGQGYALNAVQATSVYATIANRGVRVQPSLVKGITSPDGRFTPAPAPRKVRVVSEQTARQVADMLESVVSEEGTAPLARVAGYRTAGKTGTAQRVDPKVGRYSGYTASFIGFAPADAPAIVVSVTLQNPTSGPHTGGVLGGPIFRDVTSFALQTLKVPPTGTQQPRIPLTW